MTDKFLKKKKAFTLDDGKRRITLTMKIALSYSLFLLICLILGIGLYRSSTDNARESFWQQRMARLESSVAVMDNYLAAMDSYTRQLINDSTFIRFSNGTDPYNRSFILAASTMKDTLGKRIFSLANLPVEECHIYLKNTSYVISGSQFTEARQFYLDYRILKREKVDDFLEMLTHITDEERIYDTSEFSNTGDQFMLIRDIDDMIPRSIPAIIWFELDLPALRRQFIAEDAGEQAMILVVNHGNETQLLLGGQDADYALTDSLKEIALAGGSYSRLGNLNVLNTVSARNGWQYLLALPQSMATDALGNYDLFFIIIVLLALLAGAAVVMLLVQQNMRPIQQLGTQLQLVQDDNALLQEELDLQRPALTSSYLMSILSGHVSSGEELSYMMRYLSLDGDRRYMVLYGVIYSQLSAVADQTMLQKTLAEDLPVFLKTDYPLYYYFTCNSSHIVILVTYDNKTIDPLMDLQKCVLALHDHLISKHMLWFFAGVGMLCTQPLTLWESYEQARTASRYTAKHHVLLPYEVIRKDTGSVYYPIEISAKLLHFITSGNKPQVTQMFALIHRENLQERSLPVNLLNFLLSDLKNTLMKARFSILSTSLEDKETLARLDIQLDEPLNFMLCENIALQLCDFFSKSAEPSDPIPEIKAYLCENFNDPSMCLSKLSERFHISESYLSHLFKEKAGQNFSTYLEDLRLNEAAKRLQGKHDIKGDEQNLSTLYLELGYNNATTFRRAFKKRFGMTPSEMRK